MGVRSSGGRGALASRPQARDPRPTMLARPVLVALLISLPACAPPPPPPATSPPAPAAKLDAGYLVGVWTRSAVSFEDAARQAEALRFRADGTCENGTWQSAERRFTAAPGRGRGWQDRWALEVTGASIHFQLDGAEEDMPVLVVDRGRWRSDLGGGAAYFVRQE